MTMTCFIRYEVAPFKKVQFTAWAGICWANLCRSRAPTTRLEG